MKYLMKSLPVLIIMILFIFTGCDKKTVTGHDESFIISLEIIQNGEEVTVIAKNVEAELVFEVEIEGGSHGDDHGNHMEGLHPHVDIEHMDGHDDGHDGGHSDLEIHEHGENPGHYETHKTFTEEGMYEIHFSFDNDGEEVEEHFDVTVQ